MDCESSSKQETRNKNKKKGKKMDKHLLVEISFIENIPESFEPDKNEIIEDLGKLIAEEEWLVGGLLLTPLFKDEDGYTHYRCHSPPEVLAAVRRAGKLNPMFHINSILMNGNIETQAVLIKELV